MAENTKPLYTVRKQSSGYTSSETWIVWKLARDGGTSGRVSTWPHRTRESALHAANSLNDMDGHGHAS